MPPMARALPVSMCNGDAQGTAVGGIYGSILIASTAAAAAAAAAASATASAAASAAASALRTFFFSQSETAANPQSETATAAKCSRDCGQSRH